MALAAIIAAATEIAPVVSAISSASTLAVNVNKLTSAPAAEIKPEIRSKNRPLTCTVKNMTDFPVLTMASWLDTGRFEDSPTRIEPFSTMSFSLCEGDNTIMQGCSGGQSFEINVGSSNIFYFGLGFTNPYWGKYKAGCVQLVPKDDADFISKIPNDVGKQRELSNRAYKAANEHGGSFVSSVVYTAKDQDGKDLHLAFSISASAGPRPVYVISEIRDYQTVQKKA